MKRFVGTLIAMTAFLVLLCLTAGADSVWEYRLDESGAAHITAYSGGVDAVVPSEIDGYTVTGIDGGAFEPDALGRITIPATVTAFDADFMNGNEHARIAGWFGTEALSWARSHGFASTNLSRLDFADGVVDFTSLTASQRMATANGYSFPAAMSDQLKAGGLFYISPTGQNDMGCVYEITGLSAVDGRIDVACEMADGRLSYETFSMHLENLQPDYEHMTVLYDGMTLTSVPHAANTASLSVEEGGIVVRSRAASSTALGFTIEYEHGERTESVSGRLNLGLNSFDYTAGDRFMSIENMDAYLTVGVTLGFKSQKTYDSLSGENGLISLEDNQLTVRMKDSGNSFDDIELCRIPFFSAGIVTINAVLRATIDASGELDISATVTTTPHVSFDGQTWSGDCSVTKSVNAKAAVELETSLTCAVTVSLAFIPDLAEIAATPINLNVSGSVEASVDDIGGAGDKAACFDVSITNRSKVTVGAGLKYAFNKLRKYVSNSVDRTLLDLEKNVWIEGTILDEENVNLNKHFEVGTGFVNSCTRRKSRLHIDYNTPGSEEQLVYITRDSSFTLYQYVPETMAYPGLKFLNWMGDSGELSIYTVITADFDDYTVQAQWAQDDSTGDAPADYASSSTSWRTEKRYSYYGDGGVTKVDVSNMSNPTEEYRAWLAANITDEYNWMLKDNVQAIAQYGAGCSEITSVTYTAPFIATTGHSNCPNLVSVSLPDDFGMGTYSYCPKLTTINIPSSLIGVPERAFYGCISLPSVDLSRTQCSSIGEYAFAGTFALNSIHMPSTNSSNSRYVGKYAFQDSGIKSFTADCENLTVGEWAFKNAKNLTSVTLAKGATLNEYVLYGTSVKALSLENATVKVAAFNGSALETLTITGEDFTAQRYTGVYLKRLEINLTGTATITGLPNADEVIITADHIVLGKLDKSSLIKSITLRASTIEINGMVANMPTLERMTISGTVTKLADSAFYGCTLETLSLTLAPEVKIPYTVFGDAHYLKSLTISGGCAEVVTTAFNNCWALEELVLPPISGGSCDALFTNCYSLRSLDVPEGATSAALKFSGCPSLETVNLPSTVETINATDAQALIARGIDITAPEGSAADKALRSVGIFQYGYYQIRFVSEFGAEATSIRAVAGDSVTLPGAPTRDYLTFTGWYTDAACTKTASDPYTMPNADVTLYAGWDNGSDVSGEITTSDSATIKRWTTYQGNVVVPNNYTKILAGAFDESYVRRVSLQSNMRTIEAGAFSGAQALQAIYVSDGNKYFHDVDGVLYSADKTLLAVPGQRADWTLTVEEGTTTIAAKAFGSASATRTVFLPDTVVTVGADAFAGLDPEVAVIYGPSGGAAERAALQAGITYNPVPIVFMDGDTVFAREIVSAGAVLPDVGTPVRVGAKFLGWSRTPYGRVLDAKATAPSDGAILYARYDVAIAQRWSALPAALKTIESEAYRYSGLEYLWCNDSLTRIEARAFANCASLKAIYIGKNVTYIAENAFASSALETICGVAGSYAETWANGHGFTFIAVE